VNGVSEQELTRALDAALPSALRTIASTLQGAGYRCWAVGGCVRDTALSLMRPRGNAPLALSDWDLATSAPPTETQRLFRRVIPTGLQHGTVTVVLGGQHFEVTTLRGERGHSDGRRPDEVFFVEEIAADLARRDFTVNAIAYDISERTLHDPFFGLSDLLAERLRAVGDPAARFSEDGLRVLRCARFCATLGFQIEPDTASAIEPSLGSFEKVAQERVQQEWFKALKANEPGRFFAAAHEHGLLHVTAPWLFAQKDTLLAASLVPEALNRLAPPDSSLLPIYALAFLVVAGTPKKLTTAEQLSAAEQCAQQMAQRLKLSREHSQDLVRYARQHLLPDEVLRPGDLATTRRYLAQLGREHFGGVLALQRDLGRAVAGLWTDQHALLHEQIVQVAASGCALSLQDLAINGRDLLEAGVSKGPQLGEILHKLLEHVLDDPSQNDRQLLLERAQQLLQGSAKK